MEKKKKKKAHYTIVFYQFLKYPPYSSNMARGKPDSNMAISIAHDPSSFRLIHSGTERVSVRCLFALL